MPLRGGLDTFQCELCRLVLLCGDRTCSDGLAVRDLEVVQCLVLCPEVCLEGVAVIG